MNENDNRRSARGVFFGKESAELGKELDKLERSDFVTTARTRIFPMSSDELRAKIERETDAETKKAYSEMLDGCLKNPKRRLWYTLWVARLKDGEQPEIGDLNFKGLDENGTTEIGYGFAPEFTGRGLATETVVAMIKWALAQPSVKRIEAETTPDNVASQRVLQKSGFVPSGVVGEEGPRFVWKNFKDALEERKR